MRNNYVQIAGLLLILMLLAIGINYCWCQETGRDVVEMRFQDGDTTYYKIIGEDCDCWHRSFMDREYSSVDQWPADIIPDPESIMYVYAELDTLAIKWLGNPVTRLQKRGMQPCGEPRMVGMEIVFDSCMVDYMLIEPDYNTKLGLRSDGVVVWKKLKKE
jgi:hypothetical protein